MQAEMNGVPATFANLAQLCASTSTDAGDQTLQPARRTCSQRCFGCSNGVCFDQEGHGDGLHMCNSCAQACGLRYASTPPGDQAGEAEDAEEEMLTDDEEAIPEADLASLDDLSGDDSSDYEPDFPEDFNVPGGDMAIVDETPWCSMMDVLPGADSLQKLRVEESIQHIDHKVLNKLPADWPARRLAIIELRGQLDTLPRRRRTQMPMLTVTAKEQRRPQPTPPADPPDEPPEPPGDEERDSSEDEEDGSDESDEESDAPDADDDQEEKQCMQPCSWCQRGHPESCCCLEAPHQ